MLIPVGTVIRRPPLTIVAGGNNTGTAATPDSQVTSADSVFVGVTVRHNEDSDAAFRVQATGMALVRVQGPAAVGDSVGMTDAASDWEYLIKNGSPSVGKLLQAVPGTDVMLAQVMLGSGGGGGEVLPVWL